ncbi:MAG: hypothetical protein WD557_03920 [Dehalococcoidia bacterium]
MNRAYVWGGVIASAILVLFGIATAIVGIVGIQEVRDTLAEENIVGPDDSRIPGQLVDTGSEAKAQADIIRQHQLEATGGLTYSETGRFATEDGNPQGTNDASQAAKGEDGKPISNAVRNQWVTATALSTSLNMAFFAERVGYFAIVMGIALLLTGVGFGILTWQVLRSMQDADAAASAVNSPPPVG